MMGRDIVKERIQRLYRCDILKARTSLQCRDRSAVNDKMWGDIGMACGLLHK